MTKLAALTVLLLMLTACGSEGDEVTAADPGADPAATASATAPTMPAAAPVPLGEVRTGNLATVLDDGDGPELCLGAIAESYPPQCGGPAIVGWDWKRHGQQMFEQQGDVRWGTFSVAGTWDGTSFTVTSTVPGPLFDPAPLEPSPTPTPSTSYSEEDLAGIQTALEALPGFQGAYAVDGHVLAEVTYDDGSLQDWADQEYGAGVVLVTGLLVDA